MVQLVYEKMCLLSFDRLYQRYNFLCRINNKNSVSSSFHMHENMILYIIYYIFS